MFVLFVNSHGSSRIYQVDLDGQRTLLAGSGVRGNLDGPAEVATFSRPNGIAVSTTGDTLFINSSIPTIDNPSQNSWPLNPSVIRVVTGLKNLGNDIDQPWTYEGLEMKISPNPATTVANIEYELPIAAEVQIRLLDASGRSLGAFDQGHQMDGSHRFNMEIQHLASGLYEVILEGKEFALGRKLFINGKR